jgi:oligopeptide/dipeptide ABC transporter ATP-binding protein
MSDSNTVLEVQNLSKIFEMPRSFFDAVRRRPAQKLIAVDQVSLKVERHETLGLVGESGCGKTTLGRTILRLYEPSSGKIFFENEDITHINSTDLQAIRGKMQVVFQDPYSSLNPRMTVRQAISEVLRFHKVCPPGQEEIYLQNLLKTVGLTSEAADKYPRAFSGGQRQRIGLARALAVQPTFLVADEPVSALDVSIQAQILNLLADLRQELGLTMLFIAHELSVVKHISSRVAVMYLGQVVETGATEEVFDHAQHPYTEGLLRALPRPEPGRRQRTAAIEGNIPSPLNMPSGCRFHTRCPIAEEICKTTAPPLRQLSATHQVLCHMRPSPDWTTELNRIVKRPVVAD